MEYRPFPTRLKSSGDTFWLRIHRARVRCWENVSARHVLDFLQVSALVASIFVVAECRNLFNAWVADMAAFEALEVSFREDVVSRVENLRREGRRMAEFAARIPASKLVPGASEERLLRSLMPRECLGFEVLTAVPGEDPGFRASGFMASPPLLAALGEAHMRSAARRAAAGPEVVAGPGVLLPGGRRVFVLLAGLPSPVDGPAGRLLALLVDEVALSRRLNDAIPSGHLDFRFLDQPTVPAIDAPGRSSAPGDGLHAGLPRVLPFLPESGIDARGFGFAPRVWPASVVYQPSARFFAQSSVRDWWDTLPWFLFITACVLLSGLLILLRSLLRQSAALRAAQESITQLSRHRSLVQQELHDHIIQSLTVLSLRLSTADARTPDQFEVQRSAVLQQLDYLRGELRRLLFDNLTDLHAPEEVVGRLRAIATAYQKSTGTVCTVDAEVVAGGRYSPETLFRTTRFAEELMGNAARHGKASRVLVHLQFLPPGRIVLRVTDNGRGFDPALTKSGFGLRNAASYARRHRGGLRIQPAPSGGMIVELEYQDDEA